MSKRILVVDDDESISYSLAMLLREEGYLVDTADVGEAEIFIKEKTYDVCFFDYKMGRLNGLDLCRMTKDVNPQCLVFILSGMVGIDRLCNKLADGIFIKPFDGDALLQKVKDSLQV
ncbi:MAG: response regulator [Candidatus Omnitrophica bacterium]|nr:response regulator [Candidatus Omnitrophota bacterium]